MNNGTTTTTSRSLSLGQKLLLVIVWGGMFAGLILIGANSKSSSGEEFVIPTIIALIFAWGISFFVYRRASGRELTRISSPNGIRGEFRVRRFWPVITGYIIGMLALVSIMGMVSERPNSRAIWGWALTGLIPLLFYAVLLLRLRRQVTAFRVDDRGMVSVQLGREWLPLNPQDYRRVVGREQTGRYSSSPSRVDFLNPVKGVPPIVIPLNWITSRTYNTLTYGVYVNAFFKNYCRHAQFVVQDRGHGWLATPNAATLTPNPSRHKI